MAVLLLVPGPAASGICDSFLHSGCRQSNAVASWLTTNASLGRSSGAIHGHRKGRGRRTRKSHDNTAMVHSDHAALSDGDNDAEKTRNRRKKDRSSSTAPREASAEVVEVSIHKVEQNAEASSTSSRTGDETEEDASSSHRVAEIQSPVPVLEQVSQVAGQVASIGQKVVDDVLPGQVEALVEQVTEQVASLLSSDQEEAHSSDDEFEAYTTSDLPEFRGIRGLENFTVLQDTPGVIIDDLYIYVLKKPALEFTLAMFAAPIALSVLFTLLYLPQLQGLAFEGTASNAGVLRLSWPVAFQVFMFSVSLATGLQPELTPRTPYTMVVANINALFAQLIFVFLSGAVFARLSQPSQPIRFSPVALVSPRPAKKRQASHRVFMTRYVLVGPQPCELVDVKVDLSYKYNTMTRTGSFFRATESLKLVRSEVAYLNHGMLVRHVLDDTSPLRRRTPEALKDEDGIFTISVVGLERSTMQPVFHAQHYSVVDGHVIWDAEFEDMILINRKNRRILDQSRLSLWRRTT